MSRQVSRPHHSADRGARTGRPRIVVLTRGSPYAERILIGLGLEGVVPETILLVGRSSRGSPWRQARRMARRPPRDLAAAVLRRGLSRLEGLSGRFGALAREARAVGPLNGPQMLTALRSLAPDYVVLAGTGILSGEVLAIPAGGTFNVHPALLPWAPGVGVVERSLERGVPVGVTAHFVDEEIDTGPLIRRELVPAHPHDTLRSLRDKADARCAGLMVELVAAAARGEHPDSAVQPERFAYCTWPTAAGTARVETAVRGGLAVRLYQEWLERYGGRVLPLEGSDGRSVAAQSVSAD